MSVGKGLTYKLEQKVVGDTKFCDTPGLADVRQKVEAGIAIRDSLNMGGPHKVLFFCQLNDGRVNMADKTTMKLVHDAAREIGSKFGIVVNKVSKKMLKRIENQPEIEKEFREILCDGIPKTTHVLFLPFMEDLEEEEDALVSLDKLIGLRRFVEDVPTITLTPDLVEYIRVEEFDVVMQELQNIKLNNVKLETDMKALKNEIEAEKSKKGRY